MFSCDRVRVLKGLHSILSSSFTFLYKTFQQSYIVALCDIQWEWMYSLDYVFFSSNYSAVISKWAGLNLALQLFLINEFIFFIFFLVLLRLLVWGIVEQSSEAICVDMLKNVMAVVTYVWKSGNSSVLGKLGRVWRWCPVERPWSDLLGVLKGGDFIWLNERVRFTYLLVRIML